MSDKEKLELKIELLKNLQGWFTFNFSAMEEIIKKRRTAGGFHWEII